MSEVQRLKRCDTAHSMLILVTWCTLSKPLIRSCFSCFFVDIHEPQNRLQSNHTLRARCTCLICLGDKSLRFPSRDIFPSRLLLSANCCLCAIAFSALFPPLCVDESSRDGGWGGGYSFDRCERKRWRPGRCSSQTALESSNAKRQANELAVSRTFGNGEHRGFTACHDRSVDAVAGVLPYAFARRLGRGRVLFLS